MTPREILTGPETPATEAENHGARYGRRRVLRWIGGGGLVLLGGSASWLGGRKEHLLRASIHVMGTRATILVGANAREEGRRAIASAFDEMRQVDVLMSRFRADSDIGWLNAHIGRWRMVHPQTASVLKAALKMARSSDGRFDPCLDGLISRWGFHNRRYPGSLPAAPSPEQTDAPFRSLQAGDVTERAFRLPSYSTNNPGLPTPPPSRCAPSPFASAFPGAR